MRGSIVSERLTPRQPLEPPSSSRQLEILRGKLQELQTDVDFLKARLEAVSTLRARVVEVQAQVDTLRACRGEDNELIEELKNQINALWDRVQKLERREEQREAARPRPSTSSSFRATGPE